MAFDSGIIVFTTKTDKVDLVAAAHINAVQAELVTIETILGIGVKGSAANLATRLSKLLDADGSILSGSSFPSPGLTSQGFWRTDLTSFYIFDGAAWKVQGGSLSNVLFQYNGSIDQGSGGTGTLGEIASTSLNATTAQPNYRYIVGASGGGYNQIWSSKFTKVSGINTVTVRARIWTGTGQANIKVSIGGQTNNVSGTNNQTAPEWVSFTIDVSSLTNGTTYDVLVSMLCASGQKGYCANIIGEGS